jgi:hypothetical protein
VVALMKHIRTGRKVEKDSNCKLIVAGELFLCRPAGQIGNYSAG